MHLNRTLLNWGVFFVLLGAIPLAVRLGLLTEEQVARAWTLWPLLLIAAGIGLLLRRTRLEFAGGLLSAATFGIIGGGLIASGGIPFASCGDERGSVAFPAQQGELGPKSEVDIRLNCGALTIRTSDGTGWTLEGLADSAGGPRIEASLSRLALESSDGPGFDFLGTRDAWTVTLPTGSTIDLTTTLNAGEARLDLSGANLGQLQVDVNAGQATVDLGAVAAIGGFDLQVNAGEAGVNLPNLGLRGSIGANAAAVRLCPPSGAALRVTLDDNITASNNFAERGLIEANEDVWETPGYGAAAIKLEFEADVNAGSIKVEPAGSCGA